MIEVLSWTAGYRERRHTVSCFQICCGSVLSYHPRLMSSCSTFFHLSSFSGCLKSRSASFASIVLPLRLRNSVQSRTVMALHRFSISSEDVVFRMPLLSRRSWFSRRVCSSGCTLSTRWSCRRWSIVTFCAARFRSPASELTSSSGQLPCASVAVRIRCAVRWARRAHVRQRFAFGGAFGDCVSHFGFTCNRMSPIAGVISVIRSPWVSFAGKKSCSRCDGRFSFPSASFSRAGKAPSSSTRLCWTRLWCGNKGLKCSSNAVNCSRAVGTCGKSFRSRRSRP